MLGVQSLLAFAETAKRGSFAGAAREQGLTPSAVAKSVARLESELGLRLLHRTTRQVSLTSDGRALYERCRRIVDELESLRADAEGVRGEPTGTLRLNMPTTYGKRVIVPKLAMLVSRYRGLRLDLSFSDRYVDVVRDGYDAVVRIGELDDSSLVARRIGEQSILACASPEYLRVRGVPRSPSDLASHDCLVFRLPSTGRPRPLQFRDARRRIDLSPETKVVLDDGEALVAAACAGLGIIQVPGYMVEDAFRSGRLREVLAKHRPPPTRISLVYPSARQPTPRLRALIEVLTRRSREAA